MSTPALPRLRNLGAPGSLRQLGAVATSALLISAGLLSSPQGLAQGDVPAAGYRMAGRVVNADTGAPLAGAAVAIVAVVDGLRPDLNQEQDAPRRGRQGGRSGRRGPMASAVQSVTTGEDGAFSLDHVPAGKYSLEGSRRGFITASYQEHGFYSTAIVTGAGIPSENLTLKLSPGAAIAGAVSDSSSDPLEQAMVTLYRLNDDGLGSIRTYRAANTDDLGAYEFAHLPPGTYFVSASARVWYASGASNFSLTTDRVVLPAKANNLDVVYPRTYYADASDSDAATPIPLRAGDHLRIDLHMQAVPAVHLTYTLPANDSNDTRAFAHPVSVTQSVFGNPDRVASEAMSLGGSSSGNRSVSTTLSVAPGEYEVEVAGRTLQINAGGDTVLDPATGAVPTDVSGKLGAAAGATLPDSVGLTLLPAGAHGGQPFSTVAHDGVFHFEQVRPGTYEIEAQAEGRPMAIVQVAASGALLTGRVLQVGAQPVTLAATVAPATAMVSGFAQAAMPEGATPAQRGEAASGVMIVLVPKHLGDHALYRRDQSDSDGSFTLRQVAAGSYTLVAIRDGWDLEWARPEVIRHYLPGGEVVTVASASPGAVRLAKPVMVQER